MHHSKNVNLYALKAEGISKHVVKIFSDGCTTRETNVEVFPSSIIITATSKITILFLLKQLWTALWFSLAIRFKTKKLNFVLRDNLRITNKKYPGNYSTPIIRLLLFRLLGDLLLMVSMAEVWPSTCTTLSRRTKDVEFPCTSHESFQVGDHNLIIYHIKNVAPLTAHKAPKCL